METTPKKIVLLSIGSRGDTQPFVALGVRLKRLGFDVSVAASEGLGRLVHESGYKQNYRQW